MSIQKREATKDGRQYSFYVRYKDIFGKTVQYTSTRYKTKKEAELEEARFKIKVSENKVNSANLTFSQLFLEYIEYRKKDMKIQSINKLINLFKVFDPVKDVKINNFDLTMYKQFRNYIESKEYSIEYKNKIIGLLKRLIRYSNKYYNTSDKTISFIENFKEVNKIKKEMEFFTYEEFKKFISVIDEFNYKTFFEVLYFLGLRQGEATALTWNDINFSKKEVNINKTLTTKLKGQLYTVSSPKTVKSNRILPIPSKLLKSLEKLKEEAKKKKYYTDNWFVFGDELPFKESTIQRRKNKYCELANVKQIRIHDFRHSFCVMALHNGISIQTVSKFMGHAKPSITWDIYCHVMRQDLEQISELADSL